VPDYDEIVGVSLGDDATMAFRRDPMNGRLELRVARGSIYRITGSARWDWQHAITATAGLRYSATTTYEWPSAAR
jgi:alkylated DNA repair dioxygenase AlkB